LQSFLSMAANRAVDEYAIKSCGISGFDLMKNAGSAVVEQMALNGYLADSPEFLVIAGHGNNGGDGYVIASDLAKRGFSVALITVVDESSMSGDALTHFADLKNEGFPVQLWQNTAEQRSLIGSADIIVDALLGTGISGEIRTPYTDIIPLCNHSHARIISVDIPSGVTGDLGKVLEPCIRADLTISMGFGKHGCLFEPARSMCGKTVIVEIGFPEDSLSHIDGKLLSLLEINDFPPAQFTRSIDTHKYTAGKVYIIAGSRGFTGAALLSATAALRSGAGLVKLALPESLGIIAETLSLETIVEYLPETASQSLASEALSAIESGCEWADSVVLGPGIGRDPDTQSLVLKLIQNIKKPLIIDADALFALAKHPQVLNKRQNPILITPHLGEFKRLVPGLDDHIPNWQDASGYAVENQVIVLLKGAPSILAYPTGEVVVNSSGNPGMATAGSGDVLSGICASLWAQWHDVPGILNFSMYTHGKAADIARTEKGILGLIASDIVASLPAALKEYGGIPT